MPGTLRLFRSWFISWVVCVPLVSVLPGCQVLSTNGQCQDLQLVLEHSKAALDTQLPDDPSPEELRGKANVYKAVSLELKKVQLRKKELDKERHALSKQLQSIAQQLEEASNAIREARAEQPSAEATPAEPNGKPLPPPRNKQRTFAKRYLRAKNEIEGTGQKVRETLQRVTQICR